MRHADLLAQLAEIDAERRRLRYLYDHMEALDTLETVETQLRNLASDVRGFDATIAPMQQELTAVTNEIADLLARADASDARLASSTAGAKELAAMTEELTHLRARIDDLETSELELMERLDPLEAEREVHKRDGSLLLGQRAELRAAVEAARAGIDVELRDAETRRTGVTASLPPELLARYEAVARRTNDTGACAVDGNRCGGCHLVLSPRDLDAWRHAANDEFTSCPECSRLLLPPC